MNKAVFVFTVLSSLFFGLELGRLMFAPESFGALQIVSCSLNALAVLIFSVLVFFISKD